MPYRPKTTDRRNGTPRVSGDCQISRQSSPPILSGRITCSFYNFQVSISSRRFIECPGRPGSGVFSLGILPQVLLLVLLVTSRGACSESTQLTHLWVSDYIGNVNNVYIIYLFTVLEAFHWIVPILQIFRTLLFWTTNNILNTLKRSHRFQNHVLVSTIVNILKIQAYNWNWRQIPNTILEIDYNYWHCGLFSNYY